MPASFTILPDRGLVYVRYEGHITLDETATAVAEYMRHPLRRDGQLQLVDLSKVTGYTIDFVRLMALQALKADIFRPADGVQTLMVYYAPHDKSFEMAKMILRSWHGVSSVMATIQRHEREALDILGQPERRLEDLLSAAG